MKKKYWTAGIILFLAGGFIWLTVNKQQKSKGQATPSDTLVCMPIPVMKFGLPVDSFQIEQSRIKNKQNLSDILMARGISLQTIDRIAHTSRPVFDVRKMRRDNNYYFFSGKDSLAQPAYFIYEIDPVDYVVFQLKDSIRVYRGENPVSSRIRTASGIIRSSLWNALMENKLNPVLAIRLEDIYQWTIDFFGIQKGDRFRVIYEESYVDSMPVGITRIHACMFRHGGQNIYAFPFVQDSILGYYDEKGQSLKKAFLKAPLQFSRISSRYTHSRYHPVLKIRRPHLGVDYAAPSGTPVFSIGDGIITRKGYQARGGGNYLYIKHNSVYTTCYMHLKGYARSITPGLRVRQGQLIGYVGSTGLATGPHLDFRVFKNGSPIDPLKVEAPPVEPVHEQNLPRYTLIKDSLKRALQEIPVREFEDAPKNQLQALQKIKPPQ